MPLPLTSDIAPLAVVVLAATTAGVIDVRTGRIPNVLTAATALCGVLLAAAGVSAITPAMALAGGALGLGLMMPGFVLGGTGAGDVKLMAAFGTLLGPVATVFAFLVSAIAGGVLALAHAVRRRRLGTTMVRAARLAAAPVATKAQIDADAAASRFAYGPAVATGAILAALWR